MALWIELAEAAPVAPVTSIPPDDARGQSMYCIHFIKGILAMTSAGSDFHILKYTDSCGTLKDIQAIWGARFCVHISY